MGDSFSYLTISWYHIITWDCHRRFLSVHVTFSFSFSLTWAGSSTTKSCKGSRHVQTIIRIMSMANTVRILKTSAIVPRQAIWRIEWFTCVSHDHRQNCRCVGRGWEGGIRMSHCSRIYSCRGKNRGTHLHPPPSQTPLPPRTAGQHKLNAKHINLLQLLSDIKSRVTLFNNYSPKWRWIAVDIYRAASAR